MTVRLASLFGVFVFACTPYAAAAQTLPYVESATTTAQRYLEQFLQNLTSPSTFITQEALTPIPIQSAQIINTLETLLRQPASGDGTSAGTNANQELIETLLAQVAVLQAQIDALIASGATSTTQSTQIPPASAGVSGACPIIERTLSVGISGADVSNLQAFLIMHGHLEVGNATGYFGALTQAAVQAWQAAAGIVTSGSPEETGWGVVGPQTRAALQNCTA